jgi:hypothetical protein
MAQWLRNLQDDEPLPLATQQKLDAFFASREDVDQLVLSEQHVDILLAKLLGENEAPDQAPSKRICRET